MKKLIPSIFLLLISYCCLPQSLNIIPNPSFEDFSSCPTYLFQIDRAIPWFSPSQLSAGYYNSCANITFPPIGVPYNGGCNYLLPKTGNAYAGIYAEQSQDNRRTYLEVKLTEPLKANTGYHAGFWICMYDCLYLAMDMAGMYFSVDSVWCPQNQIPPVYLINAVPQVNNTSGNVLTDTANWTLISGYFKADGGEQFLVIGNFYPWNQTTWYWTQMQGYPRAYYFIDDVFVYEDSLTTGAPQNNPQPDPGIRFFPNPTGDKINFHTEGQITEKIVVTLYTMDGRKVKEIILPYLQKETETDISGIPEGFYMVSASIKDKRIRKDKILIIR